MEDGTEATEPGFFPVDPSTLEPTADPIPVCTGVGGATVAFGALWVSCPRELWRVRADTTATVTDAPPPSEVEPVVVEPDDGASPNYGFVDVEVRAGRVDPWTDDEPGDIATVLYRYRWTSDVYPGDHRCTAVVLDAAGEEIGRESFEVSSMTPRPTRRFGLGVGVSGEPASAVLSCSPERLDSPVAYEVRDVSIGAADDGGLEVTFWLVWPTGIRLPDYPSENVCRAWFERGGERVTSEAASYSVPSGHRDTVPVPPSMADGPIDELSAGVHCHPYTEADLVDGDG
jgi:hypothetical protein